MQRHIAILLTSNDTSAFSRRHPDDGLKLIALLRPLRPAWTFRIWAVKDGEFPPGADCADGFIITGSPASVHDPLDWIARLRLLILDLHGRRLPLIGICFGHQAIATALGGLVEPNPGGWRLGIAPTHFKESRPYMLPPAPRLELYAAHREQVTRLPPGAEPLGGDEFCPFAAFAVGQHILTTEYHPEFTLEFMAGLADELEGKIPAAVIAAAREDLKRPAQGPLFAQWMVRFLE